MALTKEKKTKIISTYRIHKRDTGSAEIQVAVLTDNINTLAEHFGKHSKDHHSRYGLIKMVNRRKKLLSYLEKNNPASYKELISRLELRK